MNNKVIKSFILRHIEGSILPGIGKLYEEDFFINQLQPPHASYNFLHCFAYGESIWRGKYQLKRLNNEFSINDYRWSFELIMEGDAEYTCDNVRYRAKCGEVLIMRPNVKINLCTGPSGIFRKKTILLKGPLLQYLCENGSLAGINYIQPDDSSRLAAIFDEIKNIIIKQSKYWQQEISTQSYALLSELNRLAMPHQYPAALRHALDMIDANPYRDYDLVNLSLECRTSVSTLFRYFKTHLGTSPINYIIDRRLEQAKILLGISDITLKEVAEKCGYKSESFLSRSFKKKFGISPAQFRKML